MIYLVRHGRTASNASGLLLGHANPSLDDVGRSQAAAVAVSLSGPAGVELTRVVCSPLARTSQTAVEIARVSGLDGPVTDERFIELDYGDWDGRPISSVSAQEWARWRSDAQFAPPGGESLVDLHTRVTAGLADLLEDAQDHDIAIVTHVSPIKSAVAWALGVDIAVSWRMFVQPAAVTRIALRGGVASLYGFNDVSHLS